MGTCWPRPPRVELLLDLHLDAMKPRWEASTFDRTRRDLAAFAALFGHLRAREVRPLHVTRGLAIHAAAQAPEDAPRGQRKRSWGSSLMNRGVASLNGPFALGPARATSRPTQSRRSPGPR